MKIICKNVGAVEPPPASLFAASTERATYWGPRRSTESTSASSGSWRIYRICSPSSDRCLARPLTRRVLRGGRKFLG